MTVFRGYVKVIRSNSIMICFYLGIFFAFALLFQITAKRSAIEDYEMRNVNIGIIDEDGGTFASEFIRYLSSIHNVAELGDSSAELQEKLYYREIEYIIRIPEQFFKQCIEEEEQLEITMIPGSYSGIYVNQQINSFLNTAAVYQKAGFTESETSDAMSHREEVQVKLADSGNSHEDTADVVYYFRYMPYLYLAVSGFVLGDILWIFRKKDLNKRMLASPVPARRQKLEGLLCMGLFGGIIWIVLISGAALYYGKSWTANPNMGYYILNTLALLFASLSVSSLAGMLSPNRDALTGIVNIISLGMCFLGGVFVPLEVMNSQVAAVSRFLPVYWYETANDLLSDFSVLTEQARAQVLQAVGIQMVFGAAFICLSLVIVKYKQTEG